MQISRSNESMLTQVRDQSKVHVLLVCLTEQHGSFVSESMEQMEEMRLVKHGPSVYFGDFGGK